MKTAHLFETSSRVQKALDSPDYSFRNLLYAVIDASTIVAKSGLRLRARFWALNVRRKLMNRLLSTFREDYDGALECLSHLLADNRWKTYEVLSLHQVMEILSAEIEWESIEEGGLTPEYHGRCERIRKMTDACYDKWIDMKN